MRHTVVISDVHLCEAEPGDGLWMRYRQRSFSPAGEIATMLDTLRGRVAPGELTFVLNGDIFDFDAPRVVDNQSVFHDMPRTAEYAVPTIHRILDDHLPFLHALARVLADGHTVVFVSGNHDVQLTLPDVREALRERLVRATAGDDADGPGVRSAIGGRVLFRAWFYATHDGLLVEHGNQYDPYCSYRYPMAPFGRDAHEIQPTMGSLATRLLVSRMGYFNPHVDSSFMLSVYGYLSHWARYYLFSRRSLAMAWAVGAMRMLIELVRRRQPGKRELRRANILAAVRESGAPARAVARHSKLFARPSEDRLSLVIRELWVDRVALLAFSIVFGLGCLVFASGHLALGALLGPAFLVAYELTVPKMPLGITWRWVGHVARQVAKVHHARAVVFGHTHHPEGAWENDVFFGNTGSWSAAFQDLACTKPLFDERPLVWITTDGEGGPIQGGLMAWKDGAFQPRVVRGAVPAGAVEGARPEAASALTYASAGTERARITPGTEAANASAKNATNPRRVAT